MLLVLGVSIFLGLLAYGLSLRHFLCLLLSIEFLVLLMFSILCMWVNGLHMFYSLIYLVFSVCEGALGISLSVLLCRHSGYSYCFLG